jgi:hypothetical protein
LSAPRFDALIVVGDHLTLDTHAGGPGKGAASLFYRNRDSDWPDFKGRDLVSRDPSVRLLVLAQDGADAAATLAQQMKRLPQVDEPVLLVVTLGSRDLLAAAEKGTDPDTLGDDIYDALTAVFEETGRRLSDAWALVVNVPDPCNGIVTPELLESVNRAIADVAREQGAALVDACAGFAGHVGNGPDAWLSTELLPTEAGADRLRRLLWDALSDI